VADDFVNRLAGRAEIEKVVHCPKWAERGSGPRPAPRAGERFDVMRKFLIRPSQSIVRPRPTDRQLGPVSKYRIARERCLSVTRAASGVKS
jgi:hypothetical protein